MSENNTTSQNQPYTPDVSYPSGQQYSNQASGQYGYQNYQQQPFNDAQNYGYQQQYNGYQQPYNGYQQGSYQGYAGSTYPANVPSATGAIVCGVLAILFSWLPILGIILGIISIVLAVGHKKKYGKNSSSTAGLVCGIIGSVLNVLLTALLALLIVFGISAIQNSPFYFDGDDFSYSGDIYDDFDLDDNDVISGLVSSAFDDAFDADESSLEPFAEQEDQDFEDIYGVSLTDIGVDPVDVVEWAIEEGSYEVDMSDITSLFDGEAYVNVNLNMRDTAEFRDRIAEAAEGLDLDTQEGREALGEAVEEAMDECDDMTTYVFSVTLSQDGGSWEITGDDWESLEYGFYDVF